MREPVACQSATPDQQAAAPQLGGTARAQHRTPTGPGSGAMVCLAVPRRAIAGDRFLLRVLPACDGVPGQLARTGRARRADIDPRILGSAPLRADRAFALRSYPRCDDPRSSPPPCQIHVLAILVPA